MEANKFAKVLKLYFLMLFQFIKTGFSNTGITYIWDSLWHEFVLDKELNLMPDSCKHSLSPDTSDCTRPTFPLLDTAHQLDLISKSIIP